MKKLLILLIVVGASLGASAQHRYYSHRSYPSSHVVVGVGVGSPYYPYGYYDPFYSPFYRPGYSRETHLDLRIDDIRNDYREKIWSAKHDKSLKGSERRKTVRELKHDRDQAIIDAKRNYYKTR